MAFEIISRLQILFQEKRYLENIIRITYDHKIQKIFVVHYCGLR